MNSYKHLAIAGREIINASVCFREDILESPSLLKKEWLHRSGWIAVPQELRGFVSMVEFERLAKALSVAEVSRLVMIYPTDTSVECHCMTFPPTLEALMEAAILGAHEAAEIGALDYLITNIGAPVFVHHRTADDFFVVAGEKAFVETAIGASVAAARHDWRERGSHPALSVGEIAFYSEVARWYEQEKVPRPFS